MKQILILISFFFIGCGGVATGKLASTGSPGNIKDLESNLSEKEKEYKKIKDKVSDKEDDLEEAEDDLEEAEDDLAKAKKDLDNINNQLRDNRLTTAERDRLNRAKAEAERAKTAAETERDQAQTALRTAQTALRTAQTDLRTAQTDLRTAQENLRDAERAKREAERAKREAERAKRDAEAGRTDAEAERDCWKRTTTSFCSRTEDFKNRFFAKKDDHTPAVTVTNCNDVNICLLENITVLDLSGSYDPDGDSSETACKNNGLEFDKNDFIGFKKVTELRLNKNCLRCVSGWDSCPTTNLHDKNNEGIFTSLIKIQKIKLHDTSVIYLPRNFFTSGNIDTLIEGGVTVTSFIYCNENTVRYIAKLGTDKTAHDSYRTPLSGACF